MKFLNIILFFSILLLSCDRISNKDGHYYLEVKSTKNQMVYFSIENVIVDSLKVSKEDLLSVCEESIRYADWNSRDRSSYQLPENAKIYYAESQIKVLIGGTCLNELGNKQNLNSIISFDNKLKMIEDSLGLPVIITF